MASKAAPSTALVVRGVLGSHTRSSHPGPRDGERLASILCCAAPRVGSNRGAVECVAKAVPLRLADEPAQGFYGGLGADTVHF